MVRQFAVKCCFCYSRLEPWKLWVSLEVKCRAVCYENHFVLKKHLLLWCHVKFSLLCSSGRQAARLFSMPHLVQQETTLAYLENQIAAALMLQSSHEYRHWLLIYARYLVNEGETRHAVLPLQLFQETPCSLCVYVWLHLIFTCLALCAWTQCLLKTQPAEAHLFPILLQYSGILFSRAVNRVWYGEIVPSRGPWA